MSGYGATGPYRDLPSHGVAYDAWAGTSQPVVDDEGFCHIPDAASIGIVAGPAFGAMGILAALVRAERTGIGACMEIAQSDASAYFDWYRIETWKGYDERPQSEVAGNPTDGGERRAPGLGGMWEGVRYQYYESSDGHILFMASEQLFWKNFCDAVGRMDLFEKWPGQKLADHARGNKELQAELRDIFRTRTSKEWTDFGVEFNTTICPVNTARTIRDDPQFQDRFTWVSRDQLIADEVLFPLHLEGEELPIPTPAPTVGEHSDEVLTRVLGYDAQRLATLRGDGRTGLTPPPTRSGVAGGDTATLRPMSSRDQIGSYDTPDDAAFRAEVRAFLESHATPVDPNAEVVERRDNDWFTAHMTSGREWQRVLYDGGWAGITWPTEFGGRGGTPMEQTIFNEEQARFHENTGALAIGLSMVAPTLMVHGNDEQKLHLDRMLRGEEIWCQLYSEPGAGSDLASLATNAVLDGEEYVVNGQKVWTTQAQFADWAILIARTDPDVPKHRGITYFLLDMRTPGIEVRPLKQINGVEHFNEVFLTDVRIPARNVVGEVNNGWRVSHTTLGNERAMIGGGGGGRNADALIELARARGLTSDPVVRQMLAQTFIRSELLRFFSIRMRGALSRGEQPGAEASVMKLAFSQNAAAPVMLPSRSLVLRACSSATTRRRAAHGRTPSSTNTRSASVAAPTRCRRTPSASACSACPESRATTAKSPGASSCDRDA